MPLIWRGLQSLAAREEVSDYERVRRGEAPSPEFLASLAASHSGETEGSSKNACIEGSGKEGCSAGSQCQYHSHEEDFQEHKEECKDQKAKDHAAKDKKLDAVFARMAGIPVVIFNYGLILFLAHAYFMEALPWFGLGPLVRILLSAPAAVLIIRLMYDFARAALTRPGLPEGPCVVPKSMLNLEPRWCYVCNAAKPLRCHHCKVCRRCVTRMDHHCLFIANCVGQHNQHYFIFALAEAVACLCVSSAWTFPLLMEVVCINPDSPFGNASTVRRLHLLVVFLVSIASLYMLGTMLWHTLEIIFNNETTIEGLGNKTHKRERPYFRGHLANFREVFREMPSWCGERTCRAIESVGNIMDDNDLRL